MDIWIILVALLVGAWVAWKLTSRRPSAPDTHEHEAQAETQIEATAPSATPGRTLTRHEARLEAERLAKIERHKARFAQPGTSGPLFDYALDSAIPDGHRHDGDFAVIDFETTGFSPAKGDRIVEIAVARLSPDGTVLDEFSTLVNPGARDTGPVHIHGIADADVVGAPTFAQVWPEVLRRLDGAAVVAHNAAFEERFLAHEIEAAGLGEYRFNSICTLSWARATMETPNHRLATVVEAAGIAFPDQHTALGDVRATAALLPRLLALQGVPTSFHGPTPRHSVEHSTMGTDWTPIVRNT